MAIFYNREKGALPQGSFESEMLLPRPWLDSFIYRLASGPSASAFALGSISRPLSLLDVVHYPYYNCSPPRRLEVMLRFYNLYAEHVGLLLYYGYKSFTTLFQLPVTITFVIDTYQRLNI